MGSVYPGFIVVQCWVKFLLSLALLFWRKGKGIFHFRSCHTIVVANCKKLTNFAFVKDESDVVGLMYTSLPDTNGSVRYMSRFLPCKSPDFQGLLSSLFLTLTLFFFFKKRDVFCFCSVFTLMKLTYKLTVFSQAFWM